MDFSKIKIILPLVLLFPSICLCLILLFHYIKRFRILRNYTNHSFNSISGLKFMKYAKLPTERDFFKKYLNNYNTVFQTQLPFLDMNDYDFTDVPISGCNFTANTILPKDPNFFQKIKNKQLIDCKLPSGDYSIYNFNGVTLNRVKFTKDSILPLDYNFFTSLSNSHFIQVSLPDSFSETCHLYDLSRTELCIPSKLNVSNIQKSIIYQKNNGVLYNFIKEDINYLLHFKYFALKILSR